MISINWHPSDREIRQFSGIWFPLFWLIITTLITLRGGSWRLAGEILGLAAAAGIVGVFSPRLMRPVFIAWTCAAFPIGWTVSHLLLAIVYYLVITPLGLVMRVAGRDKLNLRMDRPADTYWTARPPPPPAERYFRQF